MVAALTIYTPQSVVCKHVWDSEVLKYNSTAVNEVCLVVPESILLPQTVD